MDQQDQDDIINKIKKSGSDSESEDSHNSEDKPVNNSEPNLDDMEPVNTNDDSNLAESNSLFVKPKKLSIFAPKGSEESKFKNIIKTKLQESFMDNMDTPTIEPKIKPSIKPSVQPQVKPTRRNRPFQPKIHPGIKPRPKAEIVDELKMKNNDYKVYHNTFSSAVQEAENFALKNGYTIDEDEWSRDITMGNPKPKNGETNKYSIGLFKDGLPVKKKALEIQVYNMGNMYELNCYIN
jgi:hypothetical protein